ncbi:MAG: M28 family peptidase [Bacteroidia bacterium]|nr:M28 family peptidase [Bacteroidia bacterium]
MEVRGIKLNRFAVIICVAALMFMAACTNENKKVEQSSNQTGQPKTVSVPVPDFNADSAFHYLKTQVDFGPRVPGTVAHERCADYLKNKLESFGLQTQIQSETITTFDGKKFRLKNVIAEFNPDAKQRVLLLAHWDTRPWADADSVNKDKPFDGADDGASGVAVLLEIARHLKSSGLTSGVDILFADLEDYGQEEDDRRFPQQQNTWCLGSQYWAKNPHRPGYFAQYGILLDMVGGVNPVFPKEGTSVYFASDILNKVWNIAQNMGYGQYFINAQSVQTTDDHLYVNQLANIKCIDIVHYDVNQQGYPPYHHTHGDNMSIIDKNTLSMVGRVVMQVVFGGINS